MTNILPIPNNIVRVIAAVCSGMLILAIFWMGSNYYLLLRIVVFIGSIFMILSNKNNTYRILTFLLIVILFNPIIPIYLYKKYFWIPLDLIGAIAFMLELIEVKSKAKTTQVVKQRKSVYGRDRIYKK
jgi:uncharacterized protein DUF6804